MNKKSIRGRRGEMSWHRQASQRGSYRNHSLHSTSEVNGTLGWRRIKCLPVEISTIATVKSVAPYVEIRGVRGEKSAEAIVAGIKQTGGRNARLNNEYKRSAG